MSIYEDLKTCAEQIRTSRIAFRQAHSEFKEAGNSTCLDLDRAEKLINKAIKATKPEPEAVSGKAAFVPPRNVDWFRHWSTDTEESYIVRWGDRQKFIEAARSSPGVRVIVVQDCNGSSPTRILGNGPVSQVTLTFKDPK